MQTVSFECLLFSSKESMYYFLQENRRNFPADTHFKIYHNWGMCFIEFTPLTVGDYSIYKKFIYDGKIDNENMFNRFLYELIQFKP